ncbi:MAG: hypothetical protein NC094_11310, partial [Bacteroidales bacterium]|nr:hypothetical protein [Lachnoclostridium sp.]MCM1385362.1 hypothetical protein [Lachnoclostridium sp.]MCM1465996.1 hypothetical protein [Bacteroidales bacterium]
DSANAECKSACAALPSQSIEALCEALYRNPWLENQMSAAQPLDFLRSWYNDSARKWGECLPWIKRNQ